MAAISAVEVVAVGEARRRQWAKMADTIESLARHDKCLGRYRQLIRDLRRGAIGERCEERAEAAIAKLEF